MNDSEITEKVLKQMKEKWNQELQENTLGILPNEDKVWDLVFQPSFEEAISLTLKEAREEQERNLKHVANYQRNIDATNQTIAVEQAKQQTAKDICYSTANYRFWKLKSKFLKEK